MIFMAVGLLMVRQRLMNTILRREEAHESELTFIRQEQEKERVRCGSIQDSKAASELFFSTMSHELRTPLNAILGFTKILQGAEDLAKEHAESLFKIRQGGESLLLLVDNLLAFAKIESDVDGSEKKEFPLRKMEEDLRETVFYLLREKQLTLKVRIFDDADLLIRSDAVQFKLLIANLVAFTAAITNRNEELVLHFHQTEQAVAGSQAKGLQLEMEWTGDPWPEVEWKMAKKWLQEPSADLKLRHSRQFLNLSIIHTLIDRLNGECQIGTKNGRSSFTLSLPVQTTVLRTVGKKSPRLGTLYREALAETSYHSNILVVEDDPTNRAVIKMMLKKMGHNCTLAENGQLGVEALRKDKYDLILMDIDMPVMNGMEATQAIRQGDAGEDRREIPIVTLTAFAVPREKEKYLSLGFDYFLTKPVNPDALRNVLSEIQQTSKSV